MNNNFSTTHYDVSVTFDKYGLSGNEELYIDLAELILCQQQDNGELSTNDKHAASSLDKSDYFNSTASSSLNLEESSSSSLTQA
ncbi:unnamed protein product, partial [Rotaria magnacalcarata]